MTADKGSGNSIMKKVFKAYLMVWLAVHVYNCTPHRWTSSKRVIMETSWRLLYPIAVQFFPLAAINGVLPNCDPDELLPIEATPPYIIIPEDTPPDVAYDTLKQAYEKQDAIVVWKNFTKGSLDQWADDDYVQKTVNMDAEYTFLRNFSNALSVTLPLRDAWHDLDNLYLGFSYSFLTDNSDTLYSQLKNSIASKGKKMFDLIPFDYSFHHAFLYKGLKYSTGFHQAPASDWFFQIGNAKVWRFVEPKYTPYVKPLTLDSISLNSAFDFLPDDTRIPYVDVASEAGDLMFFPAHWWHQVINIDHGIGIGIGFRPIDDVKNALKASFFPWTVHSKALAPHRLAFPLGMIKRIAKKIVGVGGVNTVSTDSGLNQRTRMLCQGTKAVSKYIPTWSWNNRVVEDGHTDLRVNGLCEETPADLVDWKVGEL